MPPSRRTSSSTAGFSAGRSADLRLWHGGLIYSVSLIPMPDSGSMSAVAIFFIGMILTTAIELVGGWALFKIYTSAGGTTPT